MKKIYSPVITLSYTGSKIFSYMITALLVIFFLTGLNTTGFSQAYTLTWTGLGGAGTTNATGVPAGITVVTQYNGVQATCVTTPGNGANTSYSAVLRATAGSNFTITSIGGVAYGSSAGSKDFSIQLVNGVNTYTSAVTSIATSSSCGGNSVLTPLSVPAAGQTVTSGNQVTITILRAPGSASGGGYSYTKSLTVTGTVSPACTNGTISLTSGNNTQTVNQNSTIANITYSISGGANNASASGLPTGVTGSYSSGTFTISGTPSVAGSFPYTVTATGGCSSVTATGTITVNAAPTVTTTTASSIASSTAVSGGNVTSDGGSTVTARGVAYGTSANPTIAGTKTTNGTGTGTFTSSISGLQPNTQYFYRAYATNAVNTSYGSESNFNTLAAVPAAPVVNGAAISSLNVAISSGTNPGTTTYAIRETGSGNYVQANGTLAATAVWQTAAAWSTKTVTGLIASTPYNFQVKARNINNVETGFSATTNKSTLANIPGAPIVDGATFSSLNVTIDQNNNSAFAEYAIYEATSGNFVQTDGTLAGSPAWQIADLWGTRTVIDLASLTQYTFQVAARNPDAIETILGPGTDGTTLDASTPSLSATGLSSFGDVCINTTTPAASFTLSGENLTADDIIISALNGYSYSTNLGGPYTPTLTLSQPGGSFSQEVFIIFSPAAVQSYNGSIAVSGAGASNLNINVDGDGINTTPTIISSGVSGIGIDGATVSANITLTGCTQVTAYGVEYSTTPAFTNGTGTPVVGTNFNAGIFSVSLSGLNTGIVYYYHAYATNGGGTSYSSEGTFTTLMPSISVSSLIGFGNVCINNTGGPNTFTITGSNLSNANVTVATLNGYTYSTDDLQYFPSLSISQPGGAFSQLIFVKFNPLNVQSYNGNIVVAGAGVAAVNRSVTGSGINTAASVTTGSSSAVTQIAATLAGSITFVGCSPVTGYGIEYSTTNGFTNGTGIQVAGNNLNAGIFSININSLNPAVTYYYKAYATNEGGTSYGTQQSFATLVLDAPVAIAATAITGTGFTANWNGVTGSTSYRLDVSTSSTFVDPNSAATTTLAGWTFPTAPTGNPVADIATANNTTKTLTSTGTITSVSGNPGLAATITDWTNGSNIKYWQVDVDATGYYGLTISSQQQSSNTGPANFKLQYRIGAGSFIDIPGGTITVQNNFTAGVVTNLALPAACYNQAAVSIRWLNSSGTAVNGSPVASAGTSRIDNILVKGGNTPLFVTGYNNLTVNGTSQAVSGLVNNTTYYYRVRAFSATNTSPNSNTISVQTCSLVPVITGNTSFCTGTSTLLTCSAASTYQWNLNGNPVNNETNQTIALNIAGDYTVTVSNASGCTGVSAIATVTENALPAIPTINSSGPLTFCQGESVVLTSSSATGNQWRLNGNPVNGETNQTITVTNSGGYSVMVTNGSNCSSTSSATTVTVNPIPAMPTINAEGPITFCSGGSVVLASSSATGNQWSLNGIAITNETNQNITVAASGDYTVTVTNGFNCSITSAIITITVNPLADNPTATVTQPTCALGTGTITVTAPLGTGNSYTLDGTTTITWPTVSFPGVTPGLHTITVANSFGCSATASGSVMVNPQPFVPGAPVVTGIVNVCPHVGTGEQLTYTATATGNGTQTFNWILPPNVTLVSGTGTNTIVVSFPSFAFTTQGNKQIRLTVTNECGTSPMTIYYLLAQAPNTPNPISGPTDVCPLLGNLAGADYVINKAPGALYYQWSAQPLTTTVTHPYTGVNDTIIHVVFAAGFTTSNIAVQAFDSCGSSGVRSLLINRLPASTPGLIAGPTNACAFIAPNGTAATYSIAQTAGVTYNWTVPANAIGLTGQGTNTISFTYPAGFISGSISVTATNGCGTSGSRSLAISKLNPATPGIIDVIQTHFCGEEPIGNSRVYTYTLASIPANATSVLWTIPTAQGAVLVSGQGTTSITVSYPDAAMNGTVTAQAVNNCGTSTLRSITIKLPACPPPGFAGKVNKENSNEHIKATISNMAGEDIDINVFPNPAINDFRLTVSGLLNDQIYIRVMNAQGNTVKSFKLIPFQSISLGSDLNPGIYMIEARQGNKLKATRVVKY